MTIRIRTLKVEKIPVSELFFQYEPDSFLREFFPGTDEEMLRVDHSPHFRFAELYGRIGKKILKQYNDTDYIKLMIAWGRNDKHNLWKVKRFMNTYDSIKSKGLKGPISVLDKPLHKKFFKKGYEIFHGHHRAAICLSLGMNVIPCQICVRG